MYMHVYHRFRLNVLVKMVIIIFRRSLLTTFEEIILFEVTEAVAKIDLSQPPESSLYMLV